MKQILTIVFFLFATIWPAESWAQVKPGNYFPSSVLKLDLSEKTEGEIQRQTKLLSKETISSIEKLELDTLLAKYGEAIESVWDIGGSGCSWYCGGGNYDIKASSHLQSTKSISYPARNANDFNYRTAWVEGKDGSGIGEYLEYYFKNESPRVTTITITNGYVKSRSAWINNNRVKKLKLYVNGNFYGILNLEDRRSDQSFEIGTFGQNKNGKDLILKFEILEVYKGNKFDDTAITEIFFDGIDVH